MGAKRINTGGPAFPREDYQTNGRSDARIEGCDIAGQEGMSLRDYFAAKAMQGMVGDLVADEAAETIEQLASDAYFVADAMLAARGKAVTS